MPATPGDDDLKGTAGDDTINGLGGSDTIRGLGGDDTLAGDNFFGAFGNDRLFGGDGDDLLLGQRGNDQLFGGKNDDELQGRDGADYLAGNLGKDDLYGGAGADTFAFETIMDSVHVDDVIKDFADGLDSIDVGKIDADTGKAGNQAFTLVDGTQFTGAGQALSFDIGGTTFVYLNDDGDRQADSAFALTGVHDLGASDFVL